LPCVGNDVVDLRQPANAGKSGNLRVLKKILTGNEIEYVTNADKTDVALWSLWACKETAYKVIKKIIPAAAFLPRQWMVIFKKSTSTHSEGEVIIPGKEKVFVRLDVNSRYVHCVGSDNISVLDKSIWSIDVLPEKEKNNPSFYSRYRLGQHLAKHFSLNVHHVKIKRTREKGELQPPRVYVDNGEADIDISLSHDGRFVAYAFQCEFDYQT
jgi:phosphopantetheinyl transferase (holo-ACP synthase)